ncbi:helix-turn-helix transcriptional regulator [Priestia aryabhattai]|uniref:helix-turn-helix transcriptional regulator n=1 Tax=Priestia aryabhattai TaxID=412384 RepID=UPI002E20E9A5|nr:helix-turn-helix transcriptional regulator [Priestia aryabhattai]
MKHGLGKPYKTKLGRFLESKGITVTWLVKQTGLNRNTINKLVNEKDGYSPKLATIKTVMRVINKEIDKKKKVNDFFDI